MVQNILNVRYRIEKKIRNRKRYKVCNSELNKCEKISQLLEIDCYKICKLQNRME